MTKFNYSVIVFAIVVFVCTACNKKQVEQIPCAGKTNADASFQIYENFAGLAFDSDSIWINNSMVLWAQNKPGVSFTWRINGPGGMVITPVVQDSQSIVTLWNVYPPIPTSVFYTVTCVAHSNLGACNKLKSTDSSKKVFYLWPKEYTGNYTNIHYLPIWGTYKGYKQSSPNQVVYVSIWDSIYTPPPSTCSLNTQWVGVKQQYSIIRNLAYNNFSSENFTSCWGAAFSGSGCSGFLFRNFSPLLGYGHQGCYGSKYLIDYTGFGKLDNNNPKHIWISYYYTDTVTWQPVYDYFEGYKIN